MDLEYLKIGDNSFGFVDTFMIDGLNNLTTLQIGRFSFTGRKDDLYGEDYSKSFHIKNCESLESIDIELLNLPSLQSISIGDYYSWSPNFFFSPFVLRGIDTLLIMI